MLKPISFESAEPRTNGSVFVTLSNRVNGTVFQDGSMTRRLAEELKECPSIIPDIAYQLHLHRPATDEDHARRALIEKDLDEQGISPVGIPDLQPHYVDLITTHLRSR